MDPVRPRNWGNWTIKVLVLYKSLLFEIMWVNMLAEKYELYKNCKK